jgi:2-polyprenyl-3-methyl-5-hydroxy-6-metoxy-1,4-benzoquinol methylase/spore coat polysaccharide biosynthesis predicted glycosyltransferase SpsG
MALVCGLRVLGRDAWLLVTANDKTDKLIDTAAFDRNWVIAENGIPDKSWECIILDRFQTPPKELSRWTSLAPVIGIDEGGPARSDFDFLIDILPGCNRVKPNIADPSLLPLPRNIGKDNGSKFLTQRHEGTKEEGNLSSSAPLKVLISFGQEDAAGLGPAVAEALAAKNTGKIDITLLQGSFATVNTGISPNFITQRHKGTKIFPISFVPSCLCVKSFANKYTSMGLLPNLSEHLHEYDLIITHYGLTAFESLYAGVPVMLVSPGGYHEKLARAAGFYSAGVGKGRAAQLARLLLGKGAVNHTFLENLKIRCAALAAKYGLNHPPKKSLAELINGFTPNVSHNCPVCGAALQVPVLARFAERSYRHCNCCGIISMNRLNPPLIEYQREYFFESYQKQYGLTYLEDFPNLIAMGKRRLAVIKSLLPNNTAANAQLLDIGCAYGPFLAAAREEGYSPYGIDPAEDAVRYVTQTLGIPAIQGFFPKMGSGEERERTGALRGCPPQRGEAEDRRAGARGETSPFLPCSPLPTPHSPFSVITLWFVIEHFRDCVPVLKEIRTLLKPGGVLAFSTPSFSGVSGRFSLKRFLERSPADHWTIWSPAICKKALKNAGYQHKKTVNSGHHPERFPLLGKLVRSKKGPLYRLLLAVSKIFSLGDTFEVYAVKKQEQSE